MTHKEKILAVLKDGRPHTHHELYSLGCIAHSRISDLRRDGYQIEHTRKGGVSVYQLVGALKEAVGVSPPLVGSGDGVPLLASSTSTASLSASILAVSWGDHDEDAHASQGGALTLFGTSRGAYGEAP